MGWVIAGALFLAALAIVFHLIEEYFWSIVFIISAGVLAGSYSFWRTCPQDPGHEPTRVFRLGTVRYRTDRPGDEAVGCGGIRVRGGHTVRRAGGDFLAMGYLTGLFALLGLFMLFKGRYDLAGLCFVCAIISGAVMLSTL